MILIVGLGNPGIKYRKTPHNIGFLAIDFLHRKNHFPRFQKKRNYLISQGQIGDREVVLVKPLTYMNLSGSVVAQLVKELSIPFEQIWIIHDDINLPTGQFKSSFGAGAGGHKGVKSVIDFLKTKEFHRLRIGISPEQKVDLKEFVLRRYGRTEQICLDKTIKQAIQFIEGEINKKTSLDN